MTCIECTAIDVCSSCTLNGTNQAYLYNTSLCVNPCPDAYYPDDNSGAGPNMCLACDATCATCTGKPTPCQSCITGYYLYSNTCMNPCPDGWVSYTPTLTCEDCATFCIDVTINMYFPNGNSYSEEVYIDMEFNNDLDYNTFDMQSFQTVSITQVDTASYNLTYAVLSNSSYRITIALQGYVFIYNETVSVTTKSEPTPVDQGLNSVPFSNNSYSKTATLQWYILKSPSMTDTEKSIINGLASASDTIGDLTSAPLITEFKKAGVFAMLMPGAMMTSTTAYIDSVPSQNRYEATRFWGTFIHHDMPQWEQTSSRKNRVYSGPDMYDLTKDARLLEGENNPKRELFDITTVYWRFQRTGQTSFFIYDVYVPLTVISLCWLVILVRFIMRKCCPGVTFSNSTYARCWVLFHKTH